MAVQAERRGMYPEVARAFFLMSFVHNERGDLAGAGARTLQAAHAGRAADAATKQAQLANTGRCLALIERDLVTAEGLLLEAETLGPALTPRASLELAFGRGLLHAFRGEDEAAIPLLERAADLAVREADPWLQCAAVTRLARAALERGDPHEAIERCARLEEIAAKLSEGSERPFADAIRALAGLALGDAGAPAAVDATIAQLRALDSKAHLAYVLDAKAGHAARLGRVAEAQRDAHEALEAASVVGQASEAAVARALLAQVAVGAGDGDEARRLLDRCAPDLARPLGLSARAQRAVTQATIGLETARA